MKQCSTKVYRVHKTYVSVSKHLRGEKKGGWMCPSTWKLNLTRPLKKIDYTSPPQSRQAALRVTEPILAAKMFKKCKLSKHFLLLKQISKKYFKVMK